MFCQRCRGLLLHETFDDWRGETDCLHPATRCINCGCIKDSVVRPNRLIPPAAKRSGPRGMGRPAFMKTEMIDLLRVGGVRARESGSRAGSRGMA